MEHSRAELESFIETGLDHCRQGEWTLGLRYLSRVAELHTSEARPFSPAYYAHLGYGRAAHDKQPREGLELCRHAAKEAFYDPEVLMLLAKTELICGHRREAAQAVLQGRAIDPANPELRRLHEKLGVRKPTVAKGLRRSHPVNKALGKLRHGMKAKPSEEEDDPPAESRGKVALRPTRS